MSHSGLDLIDVLVSIMRSKRSSTRVVELAAELIAADARFNSRISAKKSSTTENDRVFDFLETARIVFDDCQSAATTFEGGGGQEALCDRLVFNRKMLDNAANECAD